MMLFIGKNTASDSRIDIESEPKNGKQNSTAPLQSNILLQIYKFCIIHLSIKIKIIYISYL
jgi:hypothetical protein